MSRTDNVVLQMDLQVDEAGRQLVPLDTARKSWGLTNPKHSRIPVSLGSMICQRRIVLTTNVNERRRQRMPKPFSPARELQAVPCLPRERKREKKKTQGEFRHKEPHR